MTFQARIRVSVGPIFGRHPCQPSRNRFASSNGGRWRRLPLAAEMRWLRRQKPTILRRARQVAGRAEAEAAPRRSFPMRRPELVVFVAGGRSGALRRRVAAALAADSISLSSSPRGTADVAVLAFDL